MSILPKIAEDNVLVIPLSWYSGWPDRNFDGGLVFEQGTNYCIEAMNVLDFMHRNGGQTVAIVGFPGDYGQDAAKGAKIAAGLLGMEVVYDGEGAVIPGQDQTPVITEIVASGADWVYMTTNPSIGAEILGGAFGAGFTGMWSGSTPTYDFRLLDTPVGPILDQVYYQSAYNVSWGTDVPGMAPLVAAMQDRFSDRRPSDAFVIGWNEAKVMEQILRLAAANGDMTRQGVIDAAQSIEEIELDGTAPNQTYAGDVNDYIVRATAIFKPDLATYTAAGGVDQKISQGGTTGSILKEDFFISDIARDYDYTGPCYEL